MGDPLQVHAPLFFLFHRVRAQSNNFTGDVQTRIGHNPARFFNLTQRSFGGS